MTHQRFDFGLNKQHLLDLYSKVESMMKPLDLGRSFNRSGYQHNEFSNPNWLDLTGDHDIYVSELIKILHLDNIEHVISLSEFPINYYLNPHKDIGRKCVLIIPIIGYTDAVYFDAGPVYYNDQCLLLDSTMLHWTKPQTQKRVGLQLSFKKDFYTMTEHFRLVQNQP